MGNFFSDFVYYMEDEKKKKKKKKKHQLSEVEHYFSFTHLIWLMSAIRMHDWCVCICFSLLSPKIEM